MSARTDGHGSGIEWWYGTSCPASHSCYLAAGLAEKAKSNEGPTGTAA